MSGIDTAPGQHSGGDTRFRSEWLVPSDNYTISIPVAGGGFDCDIDWGDGSPIQTFISSSASFIPHVYATAGTYEVKISGSFPRMYCDRGGSRNQLIRVLDLGDVGWTSWNRAFSNAANLISIYRTPGYPTVPVSSFYRFAMQCGKLVSIPPIKDICDRITNLYFAHRRNYQLLELDYRDVNMTLGGSALYVAFNSASSLQRILTNNAWDVSTVNRIDQMARGNGSLVEFDTSLWNISRACIRFAAAFTSCWNLKVDYSNWDISNARNDSDLWTCFDQTLRDDDIWSDALKYWATLNFTNNIRIKAAGGSKYRCDALWARELLDLRHNISDGGPLTSCDGLILAVNVANENKFILPASNIGSYNATIDWGDGSTSSVTSYNDPNLEHAYATAGEYLITITGDFPKIEFANSGYKDSLVAIVNWGPYGANNTDSSNSFEGCSNLMFVASDSTLPLCTNAEAMFKDCGITTNTATYPQTVDTIVYDSSGSVIRSASGSIPGNWARYDADVRSISFGPNATTIGSAAFRQHDCIEINIPSNVTDIGSDAFFQGSQTNIALNFSEGLQSIGGSSFQTTRYAGDIIIPTTITSIGNNAFSKINGDTTVRNYYINSPASVFTGAQTMRYHRGTDTLYVHADYISQYDAAWKTTHAQDGITILEWKTYPLPVASGVNQLNLKTGFDMPSVTNASEMFAGAFISTIPDSLTLADVTNANGMFKDCTSLITTNNLILGNIDTASESFKNCKLIINTGGLSFQNATDCTSAFSGCSNLKDISIQFIPSNMTNGTNMFAGVTLNSDNYSNFITWLNQNNSNTSVTFYGGEQQYLSNAINDRDNLTGVKLWNITDGGLDVSSINYFIIQNALSPVSRWKLGEGAGKVAIDDISGNDGEYNNSSTYYWNTSSGEWSDNSALSGLPAPTFKPTGDGRVTDCGPASAFSFIPKTGIFSIEATVRLDGNLSGDQVWRILGTNVLVSQVGFGLMFDNQIASGSPSALRLYVTNGSGTASYDSLDTSGFVWDNDWHHVVVTGDGTNIKFYIDGVGANGSVNIGNLATSDITSPLSLADFTHTSQLATLEGGLQNVAIYDTTLTPTNISELYSYIDSWVNNYVVTSPNNYYDLTDNTGVDIINQLNFTNRTNTSTVANGSPGGNLNCLSLPNNGYMYLDANPLSENFESQYSINVWAQFDVIQPGVLNTGDWIWNWRDTSADGKFGQIYYYTPNSSPAESYFRASDSGFINNLVDNPTIVPQTGKWYMFTLVWDSVNSVSKYYIDGALIDSSTSVSNTIINKSIRMAIGAPAWSLGSTNLRFEGKMFALGMWNKALDGEDVSWLYNVGIGRTSGAFFPSPTKNNLVAWYDLDSNALDSHTGNHDLVNSNVTFGSDSVRNAGLFNGSTSRMEASTFPYPNGAHTLACWVRLDINNPPSSGYGLIVGWTAIPSITRTSLLYITGDGRVRFLVSADGTGAVSPYPETGTNHLTNNVWAHLAGVYDPDALVHRVYVNGNLVAEQPAPAALAVQSGYVELGSWNRGGNGTYLDGRMANACIFDKSLTQQEIKWLMSPDGTYQNL